MGEKEGDLLYTVYPFVLFDFYQRCVFLSKNDLYVENF